MADYKPGEFARALLATSARTPEETADVVRKTAAKVKKQAQANVLMTAPRHNAGAYRAISYDEPHIEAGQVESEIGYDRKRAGRLGNLLEFGGGGDHSPPHYDLSRALAQEADAFEEALGDLGEDLMPGTGR